MRAESNSLDLMCIISVCFAKTIANMLFYFYTKLVRGMMYYREALKLQAYLDRADDQGEKMLYHFV